MNESNEIIKNKYKELTPIVMKYVSLGAIYYGCNGESFKKIGGIDPDVLALPPVAEQ